MTCHEAALRIDAYVDDEHGRDESMLVSEHVATCAACRRQVDERQALRRLLQALPYHRVPPRVQAAVAGAIVRRRRTQRFAMLAAAAAIVLVVGAVGGTTWRSSRNTSLVAREVVDRHVEVLASQQLIAVPSSDQHTVKPWFQGKLTFSPPVPDLSPAGFVLVGGRTDTVAGHAAAALVYQRRLHVINVFIWPDDSLARATADRTIRGFHERHWSDAGMSLWAVSDVNADELDAFVRAFRLN
jgi:anti-sigma factor RsiW